MSHPLGTDEERREWARNAHVEPVRDFLGTFRRGRGLGHDLPCTYPKAEKPLVDLAKSKDPVFYVATIKAIAGGAA